MDLDSAPRALKEIGAVPKGPSFTGRRAGFENAIVRIVRDVVGGIAGETRTLAISVMSEWPSALRLADLDQPSGFFYCSGHSSLVCHGKRF